MYLDVPPTAPASGVNLFAEQPPQSSRRRRAGVALAVLAVLLACCTAKLWLPGGAAPRPASQPAPQGPARTSLVSPSTTTTVGQQTTGRADYLRARITELLGSQATALLRHDETAFLSVASTKAARDALARRYRNLTAMRVTLFQATAGRVYPEKSPGRWRVEITEDVCFVVEGCAFDWVFESTVWVDEADGPRLLSESPMEPNDVSQYGYPQPWQHSDLVVKVGRRCLVATTSALARRLPALLGAAEVAAKTADAFAIGSPPDLYRIYLADDRAWRTWYGGDTTTWVAGYAVRIGTNHSDVVLKNAFIEDSDMMSSLRHELTHAATVYGAIASTRDKFWLVEGIAMLAEDSKNLNGWRTETREYIRRGWNHRLPERPPADNASLQVAGQNYGVAYLAVRRLNDRFGHTRLLDFFNRIVRQGTDFDQACTEAFGASWNGVMKDILDAVANYR